MNSIDAQPVPLGGTRVPDSMGGSSCPPWQELAEQQPQQPGGFGQACDMVLSLREQVGVMKKQVSNLAVPMKVYIYSSVPGSRAEIESALDVVDATATAIGSAAKVAAEAAAADFCLPEDVKAEAFKVLGAVRSDTAQQAADCRALCLVTADTSDSDAAKRQQPAHQPAKERPEFAKEHYGDFNLQLGPITRKLFAAQTKLLALIKAIKKQRAANSCSGAGPCNVRIDQKKAPEKAAASNQGHLSSSRITRTDMCSAHERQKASGKPFRAFSLFGNLFNEILKTAIMKSLKIGGRLQTEGANGEGQLPSSVLIAKARRTIELWCPVGSRNSDGFSL
ncbi:uncharacterized protein LOC34622249 [Cyclospora cayetanensis]|uniref:Uncharacterized protein LOC34622249 n=1 Tax=Cyclospora cayetanensis TaxID=88456 RepID=A0A6P6RSV5_9EIME|nr:uncharacterized protein LOC34622249 [Cyclospora cayetanensis]